MIELSEKAHAELKQLVKGVGWSVVDKSSNLIAVRGPNDTSGYIHIDEGVDYKGKFDYLKIAFSQHEYEEEYEELLGVAPSINQKSGRNWHPCSGYEGFQYDERYDELCGKAYRVDDLDSLKDLLEALDSPIKTQGGSLIKSLHLCNFKGIGARTDIPLKPVTLLFGPNSAGKSTVLHALLYAREILVRRNLDPDRTELGGERVDLGGYENFVHAHDINHNSIELGFTLDLRNQDLGEDVLTDGEHWMIESAEGSEGNPEDWLSPIDEIVISLHIGWSQTRGRPLVRGVNVHANGSKIIELSAPPGSRDVQISYINLHHEIFIADSDDDGDTYFNFMGQLLFDSLEGSGRRIQREADGSDFDGELTAIPLSDWPSSDLGALPDLDTLIEPKITAGDRYGVMEPHPLAYTILVKGFITGLLVGPLKLIRDELERLTYLGPLRDLPPRDFLAPRSPDKSRWSAGLAAWDELAAADSTLLDQVNDWLYGENRLDSSYLLQIKNYKQLEVDGPAWLALTQGGIDELASTAIDELDNLPTRTRVCLFDTSSNTELQAQDVGVGISQLLPVVIASLVNRFGLVAVEQPELHIHPAWQVVLGDLILKQSKENNTTFLIETHSEHLLLRLLKRIRQTANNRLPKGETEAYVDDIGVLFVSNDGTELDVRELRIDGHGRMLDEWPPGFFDEAYDETFKD